MIIERAVVALEATRRVRVRAQLRKLPDVAHAAAFCRINEAALLFFNLRGRRYQQEETIDSHQSACECLRFREVALNNFNPGKCNRSCLGSIANKSPGRSSVFREFLD